MDLSRTLLQASWHVEIVFVRDFHDLCLRLFFETSWFRQSVDWWKWLKWLLYSCRRCQRWLSPYLHHMQQIPPRLQPPPVQLSQRCAQCCFALAKIDLSRTPSRCVASYPTDLSLAILLNIVLVIAQEWTGALWDALVQYPWSGSVN